PHGGQAVGGGGAEAGQVDGGEAGGLGQLGLQRVVGEGSHHRPRGRQKAAQPAGRAVHHPPSPAAGPRTATGAPFAGGPAPCSASRTLRTSSNPPAATISAMSDVHGRPWRSTSRPTLR